MKTECHGNNASTSEHGIFETNYRTQSVYDKEKGNLKQFLSSIPIKNLISMPIQKNYFGKHERRNLEKKFSVIATAIQKSVIIMNKEEGIKVSPLISQE